MIWKPMGSKPSADVVLRMQQAPNYRDGKFENLEHTPVMAEDYHMGKVMLDMMKRSSNRNPSGVVPSEIIDLTSVDNQSVVWFGHSSNLLTINGKRILVDPVFSGNASPVSFMIPAFKGSNVYDAEQMPDIDVLVITHDHYDHLDYKTVTKLIPKVKEVVCSIGVGAHLLAWGYRKEIIHELYWHESVSLFNTFKFTAEPARHFSGRGITRNISLWSAFVLESDDLRIFIGGDSGYGKHFKEIGARYQGFDFALMECGQYNPAWKYIHMAPEETVLAANDIGASVFMPVHWGKFALSLHAWNEPAERVYQAASTSQTPMVMPRIGQPYVIGTTAPIQTWWR